MSLNENNESNVEDRISNLDSKLERKIKEILNYEEKVANSLDFVDKKVKVLENDVKVLKNVENKVAIVDNKQVPSPDPKNVENKVAIVDNKQVTSPDSKNVENKKKPDFIARFAARNGLIDDRRSDSMYTRFFPKRKKEVEEEVEDLISVLSHDNINSESSTLLQGLDYRLFAGLPYSYKQYLNMVPSLEKINSDYRPFYDTNKKLKIYTYKDEKLKLTEINENEIKLKKKIDEEVSMILKYSKSFLKGFIPKVKNIIEKREGIDNLVLNLQSNYEKYPFSCYLTILPCPLERLFRPIVIEIIEILKKKLEETKELESKTKELIEFLINYLEDENLDDVEKDKYKERLNKIKKRIEDYEFEITKPETPKPPFLNSLFGKQRLNQGPIEGYSEEDSFVLFYWIYLLILCCKSTEKKYGRVVCLPLLAITIFIIRNGNFDVSRLDVSEQKAGKKKTRKTRKTRNTRNTKNTRKQK